MLTLKACFSIFRIKTAESLQYRMAMLAGASTSIFWALIEITVMTVFYTYSDAGLSNADFALSLRQAISYIWLGQVLFTIQPTSLDADILEKITSGNIGIELCRPLDLYLHWYSKTGAGKLTTLIWRGAPVLLAGCLISGSYGLAMPQSSTNFILFLLSICSALLLCNAYGMLIVGIRLNIPWGDGPSYMLMLLGGILSGNYLPLQLWPAFMQKFLFMQPFAGYLDLPLRLYVGSIAPESARSILLLQLSWTVLFIIIGRRLMQHRLRTVVIQGG